MGIAPGEWDVPRVPDHLRVTFSIEAPGGRVVARGKDLEALRPSAGGAVREGMAHAGRSLERTGLTTWDIEKVPETFEGRAGGQSVIGHPALVDEGASVALRVLADAGTAEAAHRAGVRRLLLLGTTAPWKRVLARLTNAQKLALADNPHGSVPALLQDCLDAAVDAIVAEHVSGPVRTQEAYAAALAAVRTHAATRVLSVIEAVEPVLALRAQVLRTLDALAAGAAAPRTAATRADVLAQVSGLLGPGFVAASGVDRLGDLQRYLRAAQHRLERAATNPREAVLQESIDTVETAYADLLDGLPAQRRRSADVVDIAWTVEELRVSLFAQSLGTTRPVSQKRALAAIAAVAGNPRGSPGR